MINNSEVLYYWKMHNNTDVFGMIGTWQMLLLFDHWKWSIAVCAIIKKTVNTYCCLVLLENGEWYVSFVYYCSKDNYFGFVWGNRLNSNMIAIYLITVQIAMSLLRWSCRPELLVFSNIICSLCTCSFNNHIGMISEIANNILTNIGCSHCANNIAKTAVTAIIQVMLMK